MVTEDEEPELTDGLDFATVEVRPGGRLKGHVFQMRWPSARMWIEQRRGTFDNVAMYEEILDAIVSHDLDRDPGRLPPIFITEIGTAWFVAIKDAAVPPVNGSSSEKP